MNPNVFSEVRELPGSLAPPPPDDFVFRIWSATLHYYQPFLLLSLLLFLAVGAALALRWPPRAATKQRLLATAGRHMVAVALFIFFIFNSGHITLGYYGFSYGHAYDLLAMVGVYTLIYLTTSLAYAGMMLAKRAND